MCIFFFPGNLEIWRGNYAMRMSFVVCNVAMNFDIFVFLWFICGFQQSLLSITVPTNMFSSTQSILQFPAYPEAASNLKRNKINLHHGRQNIKLAIINVQYKQLGLQHWSLWDSTRNHHHHHLLLFIWTYPQQTFNKIVTNAWMC